MVIRENPPHFSLSGMKAGSSVQRDVQFKDSRITLFWPIILREMLKRTVELVRNLVAHGDEREGKSRGNWRMEWVASTLTPPPNVLYPALLKLMRTSRLPAVDWTDAPTDLNGLVRFGERRNLVSARVPSRSARAILHGDDRPASFPWRSTPEARYTVGQVGCTMLRR